MEWLRSGNERWIDFGRCVWVEGRSTEGFGGRMRECVGKAGEGKAGVGWSDEDRRLGGGWCSGRRRLDGIEAVSNWATSNWAGL